MLGAGGAGGAGQPPLSPEACAALGNAVYCTDTGTGGSGGDGGAGGDGGTGGAGGAPGFAVCDEGLCFIDAERQAQCEAFMPVCLIHCETEVCGEDECIGIVLLFICNE
jgi:hypothetical protein